MHYGEMDYERITYETTPATIWITLARPDQLNLVDDRLFDELLHAFSRASLDEERTVVVFRGSGSHFSGGGDLNNDMATRALDPDPDYGPDMFRHVHHEYAIFSAIESCPKTTIAGLNGPVFGAGVTLSLLCDLVVAVRDASLSFAPGKWGLCDPVSGSRMTRRIGYSRAADLLMTGRSLSADEGLQIGLVNRVCEREEFDACLTGLIKQVLSISPLARRMLKQTMQRDLPKWDVQAHYESSLGPDFPEGVRAFQEKRVPRWRATGDPMDLLPSPTKL